jgi:hypothetical protein
MLVSSLDRQVIGSWRKRALKDEEHAGVLVDATVGDFIGQKERSSVLEI